MWKHCAAKGSKAGKNRAERWGMSQIDELQSRLTVAMERIGAGVTSLAEREAAVVSDPGLEKALEEERLANAQLEERLRALKAQHDDEITALRAKLSASSDLDAVKAQLEAQAETMGRLDMDVQRLRLANEQLRQSNGVLREANENGVGEPHLINKAMLAELEGLRAARATDVAEVGAVLAKLQPLLENANNLPDGEDA